MKTFIGVATAFALTASAQAGVILSPTAVTPDTTFPGYNPNNLINQSGLSAGFVSGVTDFDAYIASDPTHGWQLGNEWFSAGGVPGATLDLDLGAVFRVLSLALWTDEYWGAGTVSIATSLDGLTFTTVGSGDPTDWPTGPQNYSADVFGMTPSAARYVRLTLSGCPQPQSAQDGGGCGLGEIAFNVTGVPEPSSWALMIAGFGLAGAGLRTRRRTLAFG